MPSSRFKNQVFRVSDRVMMMTNSTTAMDEAYPRAKGAEKARL